MKPKIPDRPQLTTPSDMRATSRGPLELLAAHRPEAESRTWRAESRMLPLRSSLVFLRSARAPASLPSSPVRPGAHQLGLVVLARRAPAMPKAAPTTAASS